MTDELLADRYKLVRPIGEGGYGTVWLARDEQLHRDVAVKKLNVSDRSAKAAARRADRFRHEAISMAKIEHPGVVTIYDVGTIPDSHELFLVMELLAGRSLLEELIEHGPLERHRVLKRFIETLDGLQAAHDEGIVHKDLKPANLYLHRVDTPREQMKVIDFGIARMDSLTKLTGTGRVAGSPRYLAPEYIMGEPVSPAIDIYQTALLLVEALSGEPCVPQGLEFYETCERHILSKLEIPLLIESSPLGPVLRQALKRQPSQRYQSAGEFADELRAIDPDDLPALDTADTVRMQVPSFAEMDVPDSEPTVSAMVERLREQEAQNRPVAETNRYAGVHQMTSEAEDELEQARRVQATPGTHSAEDVERAMARANDVREQSRSKTELRLIAGGAVFIALVVLVGTFIFRNTEGKKVVKEIEIPSKDTCLLRCTRWYDDPIVQNDCQTLCRDEPRPPTSPPFPLPSADGDRGSPSEQAPANDQTGAVEQPATTGASPAQARDADAGPADAGAPVEEQTGELEESGPDEPAASGRKKREEPVRPAKFESPTKWKPDTPDLDEAIEKIGPGGSE